MSKDLNELIVIEPEKALTVFTTDKALEPYLNLVKTEIDKHVPDVSTKKGREAIASLAYKVAQVKSAIDKIGKELKDEQKKIPDLIDSARNYAKETLQGWQDEVRQPLTDWETKEKERIAGIKLDLIEIIEAGCLTKEQWDTLPIDAMRDRLKEIENQCMDKTYWHEFLEEAVYQHKLAVESIRAAIERRIKYDDEQAELAKLRAEKEEREAREASEAAAKAQVEHEERIRQEAVQKAQREAQAKAEAERQAEADRVAKERQEAEQRELAQKLALEKAEREKTEAEARERQAKIDAENASRETEARIKREQEAVAKKEQEELERRERNKKHLAKINNEAMQGFIAGGMDEESAKLAVTLIAKKVIPNVLIQY